MQIYRHPSRDTLLIRLSLYSPGTDQQTDPLIERGLRRVRQLSDDEKGRRAPSDPNTELVHQAHELPQPGIFIPKVCERPVKQWQWQQSERVEEISEQQRMVIKTETTSSSEYSMRGPQQALLPKDIIQPRADNTREDLEDRGSSSGYNYYRYYYYCY